MIEGLVYEVKKSFFFFKSSYKSVWNQSFPFLQNASDPYHFIYLSYKSGFDPLFAKRISSLSYRCMYFDEKKARIIIKIYIWAFILST